MARPQRPQRPGAQRRYDPLESRFEYPKRRQRALYDGGWGERRSLYHRWFKANETTFGEATFHRERIAWSVIDAGHARA